MARDDIPGARGVPGGPGGHQGAPEATRLLPTPKYSPPHNSHHVLKTKYDISKASKIRRVGVNS